jgi:hypothetical protein
LPNPSTGCDATPCSRRNPQASASAVDRFSASRGLTGARLGPRPSGGRTSTAATTAMVVCGVCGPASSTARSSALCAGSERS